MAEFANALPIVRNTFWDLFSEDVEEDLPCLRRSHSDHCIEYATLVGKKDRSYTDSSDATTIAGTSGAGSAADSSIASSEVGSDDVGTWADLMSASGSWPDAVQGPPGVLSGTLIKLVPKVEQTPDSQIATPSAGPPGVFGATSNERAPTGEQPTVSQVVSSSVGPPGALSSAPKSEKAPAPQLATPSAGPPGILSAAPSESAPKVEQPAAPHLAATSVAPPGVLCTAPAESALNLGEPTASHLATPSPGPPGVLCDAPSEKASKVQLSTAPQFAASNAGPPGRLAAAQKTRTLTNPLDCPQIAPFLEGVTTVIVRKVPSNMSRATFLAMLDAEGFERLYTFLYLPKDFQKGVGLGYAIVNFAQAESASAAALRLSSVEASGEWLQASISAEKQSLSDLIRRYRDSAVMHSSVPDECKPILFSDGLRVPFPEPTKTLDPPVYAKVTRGVRRSTR